ncbi:MAG TPA: N-acetylmuramoyl-L-alanine amidase [Acidaminococcaceae bacterium]|nr:N-acetylmuramoyl-L-alanine amidase [Acidaminococcaceae bacterium]
MKRILTLLLALLFCVPVVSVNGKTIPVKEKSLEQSAADSLRTVTAPVIIDRPVRLTEYRKQLIREYAFQHYGEEFTEIVPQTVIVHWTESPEADGVYDYFYRETRNDGTLNVCSQFLVDRDGTIFRLTPETMLDRHAIGYNWCAIGIENVGGTANREDLTEAQLQANVLLIRYLQEKYPTVRYVWGHYQQTLAKKNGLFRENVSDYFHGKVDPGPKFMKALHKKLKDTGLLFFEP